MRKRITVGPGLTEIEFLSDEDFVPGVPVKRRILTEEEMLLIVYSGDPGRIEWPQKMLPEHKDEHD
jgi:hypothetical protein